MPNVNAKSLIARLKSLPSQTVLNETYIITPENTTLHRLNEVGTFVWDNTDMPETVENLIIKVCERFDVEPEDARKDVIEFIRIMHKKGLLSIS
ncbi:MAG: PqqD family protein [Planctomycetes bacterium]|nr:PqqD family protein [Planctomycetota bacterium]